MAKVAIGKIKGSDVILLDNKGLLVEACSRKIHQETVCRMDELLARSEWRQRFFQEIVGGHLRWAIMEGIKEGGLKE
jgi:hypothetical protein